MISSLLKPQLKDQGVATKVFLYFKPDFKQKKLFKIQKMLSLYYKRQKSGAYYLSS